VAQLALIGRLQYRSGPGGSLNSLRTKLALGPRLGRGHETTLLAARDADRRGHRAGIGLRAVVIEGTTAPSSPTARPCPTTVFPVAAGDSVLLGRASLYGGPFGRIAQLRPGQPSPS